MSLDTLFPLIISNTDLSLWSMCELRWFRERCQNLRKVSYNIDLIAGGSFAVGMEKTRKAFYNDKLSSAEAIAIGYSNILESMHEQIKEGKLEDDKLLKSPERMALALIEYFKKFALEDEEVLPAMLEDNSFAIEHKFTLELPILHPELNVPLIFKGKLDMLGVNMGRTYIIDEKTTKAISSNTGELLQTAGQFIGYAWLAREKGIKVQGIKVRKVAIQIREIKIEEFEIPITEFMVDCWYYSFLSKIKSMIAKYNTYIEGDVSDFKDVFLPDYQHGCTAFFRSCPFSDGCMSKYGETFIESNFEQIAWDSETRTEIPLVEYKKLLGLV
jgi:hypothetical protein